MGGGKVEIVTLFDAESIASWKSTKNSAWNKAVGKLYSSFAHIFSRGDICEI